MEETSESSDNGGLSNEARAQVAEMIATALREHSFSATALREHSSLVSHQYPGNIPPFFLPAHPRPLGNHTSEGVAVLLDGEERVGTFIFLGETIGIVAFHEVYVLSEHRIREETLCVRSLGYHSRVSHIISWPYFGLAVFKVLDRKPGFHFNIGIDSICIGDPIALLSYAAFAREECTDPTTPVYTSGYVLQDTKNSFLLADYQSRLCRLGGVVLSNEGNLIGMHIGSVDFDYETISCPSIRDYRDYDATVESLRWVPPDDYIQISSEASSDGCNNIEIPVKKTLAEAVHDAEVYAKYATKHPGDEGHRASFLPSHWIRFLLHMKDVLY